MYSYIKGSLTYKSPAQVIIEAGGIGYEINISLHTYDHIQQMDSARLYTYFYVKEDIQALYGFATEDEKKLFTLLISVSGIGPNTARMVLSSYPPAEIQEAILNENEQLIKSIKGIGPKTAKRLILELKDKLAKDPATQTGIRSVTSNTLSEEALSALIMLGFSKIQGEKAIQKSLNQHPGMEKIEDLVKEALKNI